jgi:serine protease
MTTHLRALRRAAGSIVMAACATVTLPSTAAPGDAPRPVHSLLVQLRDAPSHATLARERDRRAAADAPLAARESLRWQRVLEAAGPQLVVGARRAVGGAAQSLRLAEPLTHAQAQQLAQRLAALPEVGWVAPGGRERRLQQAGNPPDDFWFVQSFHGQWWLLPQQGSDGLPIERRLRGAPGFLSAWTLSTTGAVGASVAVLDSGITDHPEVAGRTLPGYDMVSDLAFSNDGDGRDADPSDPGDWVDASDLALPAYRDAGCRVEDSSWHGTAIAGMLAARTNDTVGVAAMNWAAPVLPVRVATKCGADVEDIIDGMRWAAGLEVCRRSDSRGGCIEFAPLNPNPVRIVSLSFGGDGACNVYQPTIDELRGRGVVIVAAAGNEHATPTRPAKCPGVVGVVATNRDGFKSNYSNFGPELTASGIATVGGDDADPNARWSVVADSGLLSIGNNGRTSPAAPDFQPGYYSYFGTSFSAPVVAGALSLMLSVNPQLSADQMVDGLRRSARLHVGSTLAGVAACSSANPGRCLCTPTTCGAGLLDVPQALRYALDPGAYVAPARQPELIDAPELASAAALGLDREPVAPPPVAGGGGGGGASSAAWLLALLAATLALRRRA